MCVKVPLIVFIFNFSSNLLQRLVCGVFHGVFEGIAVEGVVR